MVFIPKSTEKTNSQSEKFQKIREARMEEIYDFLEKFKDKEHTAYSISKDRNLTLSTIQRLVSTLVKDGFLVEEEKIENGRLKKIIRLKMANEMILEDISENSPNKDDLIERAFKKGYSVTIRRPDGTQYELKPKLL